MLPKIQEIVKLYVDKNIRSTDHNALKSVQVWSSHKVFYEMLLASSFTLSWKGARFELQFYAAYDVDFLGINAKTCPFQAHVDAPLSPISFHINILGLNISFAPDRPFHNFIASRLGDRRILFSIRTSCDGFWSPKIVKRSVGYFNFLPRKPPMHASRNLHKIRQFVFWTLKLQKCMVAKHSSVFFVYFYWQMPNHL